MIECNYDGVYRSRSNQTIRIALIVVRYVVKNIWKLTVVRKWWENARFCPENAKNKAENEPFSALFGTDVHNQPKIHTENPAEDSHIPSVPLTIVPLFNIMKIKMNNTMWIR